MTEDRPAPGPSDRAIRVDKSLLPECRVEIAIVSDGHYALAHAPGSAEFPSRGKQSSRLAVALALTKGLQADVLVHLGDLTQEVPESPLYPLARQEGIALFRHFELEPVWVPGNQDVGDKIDPTSPARPVNDGWLADFEKTFGPQWQMRDVAGSILLFLNSQLLNSSLPAARRQREWLESILEKNRGKRFFAFLHLPPFLCHPGEPGLGHYDNIGGPDRAWLVELFARHAVQLVFSGHVHQRFLNVHHGVRYLTLPSPAFTRPGFSQALPSAAPPERGRDDRPKLGVTLLRITDSGADVHFLRTNGAVITDELCPAEAALLLTPMSRNMINARLGVTLVHPLATSGEVPLAWPSMVRQPIRNEYPLLALLELAPAWVRTPLSDLDDPLQKERLAILRAAGIRLRAVGIWHGDLPAQARRFGKQFDELEIQFLNQAPDAVALRQISDFSQETSFKIALSLAVTDEQVKGKQHFRTRYGWRWSELPALERVLAEAAWEADSVLMDFSPGEAEAEKENLQLFPHLKTVDFLYVSTGVNEDKLGQEASLALAAAYRRPGSRLFVSPLQDLDRTMDIMCGLVDPLGNPRRPFHALKNLHALLASGRAGEAGLFFRRGDLKKTLNGQPSAAPIYDLERGLVFDSVFPDGDENGIWLKT